MGIMVTSAARARKRGAWLSARATVVSSSTSGTWSASKKLAPRDGLGATSP
jgi:hypothetical protein